MAAISADIPGVVKLHNYHVPNQQTARYNGALDMSTAIISTLFNRD